jgi:PBP1b-binding outer membrane lipoprotein LpoB
MKKLYTTFLILVVFFVGCKTNPGTTVINEADREVTFRYSRYDTTNVTLSPGQSATSEYFHTGLYDLKPAKRVTQKMIGSNTDNVITITTLPSWEVRVKNTLAEAISLTADGWMDEMVNILPGDADDVNHKGRIYTNKPSFRAASATFLGAVDYVIVGDVIYVTIR